MAIVIAVIVVFILIQAAKASKPRHPQTFKYEKDEKREYGTIGSWAFTYNAFKLFTRTEKIFYRKLKKIVDVINTDQREYRANLLILGKIRIADMWDINPQCYEKDKALIKMASKHFDFVIVNSLSLIPILIIELNDPSHEQDAGRQKSDQFKSELLEKALPQIDHFIARAESMDENIPSIESILRNKYKKFCPLCGNFLTANTNKAIPYHKVCTTCKGYRN